MLRAAYRSIVRILPVSVKAPIKRAALSMAGGPSVTTVGGRPVQPPIDEPVTPPVDPVIQARIDLAESYFRNTKSEIARWAHHSRENDNFTFELTEQNLDYLAATISTVTGAALETIRSYLREPKADLDDYLRVKAAGLPIDHPTEFGRRLGWYAIARAMKPRVIVETGVHQGLGSVLLCAALKRNAGEGTPGKYYGTDINPSAGALLAAPFDQYGKILYGDSIASLQTLDEPIDLFINDSDHSAAYEASEYALVESRLSQKSFVLGDNSHVTDELLKFSARTGRQFLFFKEQPKNHWYPGAGIGISFRR
jgi:predicted O-methyltransferase YrrM